MSTTFTNEASRKVLVEMIIIDELPFRFVKHDRFIEFMAKVERRFEIPSCVTVVRDCLKLYMREKDNLRKVLMGGQRVCLAIDNWT